MIHQLRIYEIFEENKASFYARFRDHAARIMARHGFDIAAMWEAKTDRRTEFRLPAEMPRCSAARSFLVGKRCPAANK
jgi:hypothetical protein